MPTPRDQFGLRVISIRLAVWAGGTHARPALQARGQRPSTTVSQLAAYAIRNSAKSGRVNGAHTDLRAMPAQSAGRKSQSPVGDLADEARSTTTTQVGQLKDGPF